MIQKIHSIKKLIYFHLYAYCKVKAEPNNNNININNIIISLISLFKIDNQLQLETWHSKRLILPVQQSIKIIRTIDL